jgi:hypothetical protein
LINNRARTTTDKQISRGPVMKPLASNDSKNQNYETWVGIINIVNFLISILKRITI